jgi:glycosyltransferase involved in cell wall biosynthesis
MRVGLLVYGLDRPLSGITRYTLELARALAALDNGPEITLLTAGHPGPLSSLDVQRVALRGCRLLPALMGLGNVLIPLLARRLQLDVVHDPTGVMPFYFGAAQARTIVTVHDVFPWSYPGVSTRLDTLIYRHWLPRVLPRADAVITDSAASKADISQYLNIPGSQIGVIPLGKSAHYRVPSAVDIEKARTRYKLPFNYILFVGSIEKRKNLRRVLQAFVQLRHKGIPHKLVLAGAAKWRFAEIMQSVDDFGLQEDVIFPGYIAEEDLPALYGGSDVFLFPSFYEGFGLPVVEAMACGTPAITSNVSSLPEVAGEACLLVDPYDVDSLTDATYRVLTDSHLRQELQERGSARAAQFTWNRTARETLKVYESVFTV